MSETKAISFDEIFEICRKHKEQYGKLVDQEIVAAYNCESSKDAEIHYGKAFEYADMIRKWDGIYKLYDERLSELRRKDLAKKFEKEKGEMDKRLKDIENIFNMCK